MACESNNLETVKKLCEAGAGIVGIAHTEGMATPIIIDADVNLTDDKNMTALHIAICSGAEKCAEYLVEKTKL